MCKNLWLRAHSSSCSTITVYAIPLKIIVELTGASDGLIAHSPLTGRFYECLDGMLHLYFFPSFFYVKYKKGFR